MRDERFNAIHRGGLLELNELHLLAAWVADCVEHIFPLSSEFYPQDKRHG